MRYASDYSIWRMVAILTPCVAEARACVLYCVVRNEPKTVIGEVRGPRDDISAIESKGVTGSIKRVGQINTEDTTSENTLSSSLKATALNTDLL